mgnify:CR=1 FL=1
MPLLEDLKIYEKIARNAKCPCGSGRTFKNCCMKGYREAKKNRPKAKVSSFSPIPLLKSDEKMRFPVFYMELMIFSHQYRHNSNIVVIDDAYHDMQSFIAKERDYFYENREKIVDKYINQKSPTSEEFLILEAIKDADYGLFFLLSHAKDRAVVVSSDETYYNIQTLNSSFDEIFKNVKKYIGFKTAVFAYKNCYITDGIYHEFPIDKNMEKALDTLPYKNPEINYKKDSVVINVPVIMNFSFSTDIAHFEKMEEVLLKKVPESFAHGLFDLLDDSYFYSKQIIGSFLRSLDINEDLNFEEGEELFSRIIGGIYVMNFERGNVSDVIPYSTLEPLYQQKELSQSVSKMVYQHVEQYKKSSSKSKQQISTFYTMIGIVHIEREKIDEFENYLECFTQIEERISIMDVLHNLCEEINEREKISTTPLFLGVGSDLNCIYNEIEEFRAYEKKLGGITLEDAYTYSLTKGVY